MVSVTASAGKMYVVPSIVDESGPPPASMVAEVGGEPEDDKPISSISNIDVVIHDGYSMSISLSDILTDLSGGERTRHVEDFHATDFTGFIT